MRLMNTARILRVFQQSATRWLLALAFVAVIGLFSSGVQSSWISASTFGAFSHSGIVPTPVVNVVCGDGSQQIGFLSNNGDPLDSVNLDNPGDSVEIQVCADGLTLGGPETFQLVIEHDDSVVELINPACAGLLDGGFVSPSTKRTSDDQASAFICTKPGGVSGSAGALIKLTARRTGAGVDTLVFRTSGELSTGLYESGVPFAVSGFDSLAVQQQNPAVVATATPQATAVPFVFIPPATATPVPAQPASGPPALQLDPPSEPSSFSAVPGVHSVKLNWGVPDETSGRSIDEYIIQNLKTGEIVRVSGDVLTYTFFDLDPLLAYSFIIRAATGLGVGPTTGVGPVTPLDVQEAVIAPVATPTVEVELEIVEPTATPVVVAPSDEVRSGEIVITKADGEALESTLEGILGGDVDVTVDVAVITTVSEAGGISIEIPVDGLTEDDSGVIEDIEVQIGQLALRITGGQGTAELEIPDDILVAGRASVSLSIDGMNVRITDPVLQYSPAVVDDGSFGTGSSSSGALNSIGDVGVSFAVDLDVLPDDVGLSTTYSADSAELAETTGMVFALSGDDELGYFVTVEKSGVSQDDFGDNTVTMSVSLAWLDEMVAAGREMAITKISDDDIVFTESAQCERLSGIAVCTVTFTGAAGGFSVFAIYGFVNENEQIPPQPLAPVLPTPPPPPTSTPASVLATSTPRSDSSSNPTATPQVASTVPAENVDRDETGGAAKLGDGEGGGGAPSIIVIVAIGAVVAVAAGTVISAYYRRPTVPTAGLLVIATAVGSIVLVAGNSSVVEAGGLGAPTFGNLDGVEQLGASDIPVIDKNDFRFRKVGSGVRVLSEAYSAGTLDQLAGIPGTAKGDDFDGIDPKVDVSIWFETAEDVDLNLGGLSATVLNVVDNVVEVSVPVRIAHQLSYLPGVLRVDRIMPPQIEAVTSEGAATHGSPAWNSLGIDGTGIKVGIIDVGFIGWSSISPSELPTPTAVRCYTAIGVFTSTLSDCEVGTVHGTAVSEAVDDMAPAVEFYISNPQSGADLLAATQWMVSQGVDVINHSVGWTWDGSGDGTSVFSDSPL
ncbi:MAG: hypothetical protein V3T49_06300, partial [Dehalococcoidia bacterium]